MAINTARNSVAGPGAYPAAIQLNSNRGDTLRGIDDIRHTMIPRIYNEPKDRFVPEGQGPKFIILG
jgi:hypothetical protein